MMAILMGTYYGCFGPQTINYRIQYNHSTKAYLTIIFNLAFYLNAITNPVIYAWMNKEFNEAFRKILGLKVGLAQRNASIRQEVTTQSSNISAEQQWRI